ncbi:hypothetical protein Lal_00018837 [Lupinus albus]|nr:hypothetical protein Lal_00018837 [Lupinus albus]
MSSRSKKGIKTITAEVAMMRELAYRRMVFLISQNTEIIPSQVKPSCEVPSSMQLPGRSSSPFPSGTKRKEPTSNAHHSSLQCQQSFHGSLGYEDKTQNLYREIGQVSRTSPFNLKQHIRGQNHAEKSQELKFSEKIGKEGSSNQRQWCEMCEISCPNEALLKLHFDGKKHNTKLQKLKPLHKKKWCQLCKLWCMNECAFKQRLEGKKHIIQMHAIIKKEKK